MKYTSYLQATLFHEELCTTIAMEELSELIQAISKAKRGKLNKENIEEEIADVIICINWLIEIYKLDCSKISDWNDFKQNRIIKRLNNGDFK